MSRAFQGEFKKIGNTSSRTRMLSRGVLRDEMVEIFLRGRIKYTVGKPWAIGIGFLVPDDALSKCFDVGGALFYPRRGFQLGEKK